MNPILDTMEVRWSRALARWALGTELVLLGVLVTFAVIMTASAGGALPPEYDELVSAVRLPALYRAATVLDVAEWLGLGGFFALAAAAFARRAPFRSLLIAGCGVGQLAGAIGAFTRLAGISALAAQYVIAAPDQQPAVLQSFLDLQLVVGAHFAAGSLLWSLGLLLLASAAWSARLFSRWLAGLVALTGVCNLAGDTLGIVGTPVPFALFILPLILLAASLFGVAAACRQARASATQARRDNLPTNSGGESTLQHANPPMRGDAVFELQELRSDLGYAVGPIDGIYGPQTEAGIRNFQYANWLDVDGVAGPATWAALRAPGPQRAGD